ncbi:G-D-S-L family lipolytic protein [Flavobacterium sp. SM2513]|uniref:G-D-S-L family lipolytic protein n=1 Tax=Flavobacterium sp. SM2513 TaxID=3424766 RepID=UPI003D7FA892
MIKNFKWLLLVSLTFVACNSDDEDSTVKEVPIVAGSADFSKYVALGNSLTAGYSDNALFKAGQENAYPKLMSDQFALAGGGAFTIPFTNDNIGGLLLAGNVIAAPRLIFKNGAPTVLPNAVPTNEITTTLTGPFNNLGVPGAKSFHLLAPSYGSAAGVMTGTANPYFVRFRSSATTSIIADAVAQSPTFFSLWIGNNDVLSYATSGGTGLNQAGNMNPASYGSSDITDPGLFASVYESLINALATNGAKGVVANIPNVTSIPYFTTIPTNALPGLPPDSAGQLNQLFGGINQALVASGLPTRFVTLVADDANPLTVEKNQLLIKDESLINISAQITAALSPVLGAPTATYLGSIYGQARHASSAPATRDYIVLTAQSVIGSVQAGAPAPFNTVGVSYPMQDSTTLTASEATEVIAATTAFNASIKALADAKGLAFVDVNALMTQLANGGVRFDNFNMTAAFVQGGAFGLDGVHLTARANAYIANQFLAAINATYGSTLRMYKPGDFPISYPASLQ